MQRSFFSFLFLSPSLAIDTPHDSRKHQKGLQQIIFFWTGSIPTTTAREIKKKNSGSSSTTHGTMYKAANEKNTTKKWKRCVGITIPKLLFSIIIWNVQSKAEKTNRGKQEVKRKTKLKKKESREKKWYIPLLNQTTAISQKNSRSRNAVEQSTRTEKKIAHTHSRSLSDTPPTNAHRDLEKAAPPFKEKDVRSKRIRAPRVFHHTCARFLIALSLYLFFHTVHILVCRCLLYAFLFSSWMRSRRRSGRRRARRRTHPRTAR